MQPYLRKAICLLCGFIIIILFQQIPSLSHFYANHIYPLIRTAMNGFSSFFPFSLYDLFIVGAIVGVIIGIVCLFFRTTRKKSFFALVFGLGWVYIAFYALWGINYFAPDFMTRNQLTPVAYDSAQFRAFLSEYTNLLNQSYTVVPQYKAAQLDSLIRAAEQPVRAQFNFPALPASATVKPMLFGTLYASMGIRGYYGPFFAESHVNPRFLPHERPAVTAHELGHLAGITSEAEANLYAYLITTRSENAGVRFSGYYSILPYVLANAYKNLPEPAYRQFVERIDPQIIALYRQSREHWQALYSERLGNIQDWLYEAYLKGNNIPSGQANYSEVVGLLIAIRNTRLTL